MRSQVGTSANKAGVDRTQIVEMEGNFREESPAEEGARFSRFGGRK